MKWAEFSERHRNKTCSWQGQLGSLNKFQVDPTMLSHQNMPRARLIKQAAGLLRTQFIPHDTRWQAARRGLQPVGLDRFLFLYLLYDTVPRHHGQHPGRTRAAPGAHRCSALSSLPLLPPAASPWETAAAFTWTAREEKSMYFYLSVASFCIVQS
jgi:hypothetical protein